MPKYAVTVIEERTHKFFVEAEDAAMAELLIDDVLNGRDEVTDYEDRPGDAEFAVVKGETVKFYA